MSWRQRLEIAIILWLNRFFPRPAVTMHTEEAAGKPRAELEQEEFARGRDRLALLGKWTFFEHKVVLDLACGQGIKTTSYAASDPEVGLVVGIDLDAKALETAREFSRRRDVGRVTFVIADAGALPFRDESVDIVVSENAFEHMPRPQAALLEAARVLKDQGILSLRFFPLYDSRFGSHLWDYLWLPWVQTWASPEAVAAAYARIVEGEAPRLLRQFAGRYDERDLKSHVAAQIEQFMTLNKLTPRGFCEAVAASGGWQILHFRLIETPRVERLLALLPGVDRFTVWGIECVLRRDKQATLSAMALSRWRWRQGLRKMHAHFVGRASRGTLAL